MSKLDKKVISLLLIFTLLFSCFSSLAVYASEGEEEFVEITDETLKQALKYWDPNNDGKYTKEELENVVSISLGEGLTEKGYEELKNLTNLNAVSFTYLSGDKTVDLTGFSKLSSISVDKVDKESLPTINVPDNIVLYGAQMADEIGVTNAGNYVIESFEIKEESIYVGQAIFLFSTWGGHMEPTIEINFSNSNVELEKGDNYNQSYSLRAKKAGSTDVTLKSEFSEKTVTITISESKVNANPEEKTNCDSAKLYYNAVLTASGDLYRANLSDPKAQMKKIDSNVSKYVYPTRNLNMYLKGNTATILSYDGEDTNNPMTKTVENVKDISEGWNFASYLTTDGTLNKVTYKISTEEDSIVVEDVDTNVTKTEGNFYVKDGKTYYIETKALVSEQAFDSAEGSYYLIGNTLYSWSEYDSTSREVANNVSKIGYGDFQPLTVYTLTDGSFYNLNVTDKTYVYSWNGLTDFNGYATHNAYTLKNNYELYYDDINLVLTDVINAVRLPDGLLALRKDGSVWYQENPYEAWTCVLENTKGEVTPEPEPEPTPEPTPEVPNYTADQIANLLFDANYYANKYADLKAAFGNDEAALRTHWLTNGINEGRQASPIFNPAHYLNSNVDLKNAYGNNYKGAYEHFINFGWKELRESSKEYWGEYYKNNNSDLKDMNPYDLMVHYINFGIKEGRQANEASEPEVSFATLNENDVFNAKLYSDLYSDLKAAFGDNAEALKNHWLNTGINEGRIASLTFDAKYYLNKYEDLAKAFGNDYKAAYEHFKNSGIKEGRQASEFFDVKYYLENNEDLKKAFGSDYVAAINHFASNGITEGRDASAEFKLSMYKKYEDLAKAFGNNNIEYYKHYIVLGKAEGRKAN